MNRLLAAAAALALATAGQYFPAPLQAQSRDAVKWRVFESAEGKFKIEFPDDPVVKRGKFRTEIGDIASARHSAGDGADATYDVTYNDYPKAGIAKLTPKLLLDAARDGLVAQSKGRLASDKPYALGKFAGRDLEITGEDGMHYRVRLLLIDNRLYQLTAMARPPARPDEQRFFRSFRLDGISQT